MKGIALRLIFSCREAATLGIFLFPAKNFRPLAAKTPARGRCSSPILFADDFSSFIGSAIFANAVGEFHLPTVRAFDQAGNLQFIMGAAKPFSRL